MTHYDDDIVWHFLATQYMSAFHCKTLIFHFGFHTLAVDTPEGSHMR